MKKTKLIKIFLVIAVCMSLVLVTTQAFAEDTTFTDITNNVTNDTDTNNATSNTDNTVNNTNTTNNTDNTDNTNALNTNSNTNSSSYNNTNLPSTGIAQTGSLVCIVFALIVSAVYAFKKIRDYNNI